MSAVHFSDTHKALTALGMGLIIIFAIFGNALVVLAFGLFKNVRTVNNCFILFLAVSDLLVALVPLPMWMTFVLSDATWWTAGPQERDAILRAWVFLDVTCGLSSIFLLTCISVERYICVVHSCFYRRNASAKRALVAIGLVWAVVLTLASFRVAYIDLPRPTFEFVFAYGGFLVPFLVIIAMYGLLLRFVGKQVRAVADNVAGSDTTSLFREKKTAKVMIVIVALFFVCWFPFFLLHFVTLCGDCTRALHKPSVINAFKWLHYSNSVVNPVVYAGMSRDFRKYFKTILGNVLPCWSGRRRRRLIETSSANQSKVVRSETTETNL